jgi:hypothetical protein
MRRPSPEGDTLPGLLLEVGHEVPQNGMNDKVAAVWIGRRLQSAGRDARVHFSAAC